MSLKYEPSSSRWRTPREGVGRTFNVPHWNQQGGGSGAGQAKGARGGSGASVDGDVLRGGRTFKVPHWNQPDERPERRVVQDLAQEFAFRGSRRS